jgi:cryptochrome
MTADSLKFLYKQYIYEPWEAPISIQKQCGVVIGENYPYPIVEHTEISKANMSRMKEAYDAQKAGEPMPAPPESLPTREQRMEQADAPAAKRRKT